MFPMPPTDACCCCRSNARYKEEYLNLLSIEPKIQDLVTERPLSELASQLDLGRTEVRSSQVFLISGGISKWDIGVPENKHLRGFGNDVCGRLLCPSNRDWDNPVFASDHFSIFLTA